MAVFWAILVSFLALVLVRLAQTLKATTKMVAEVSEQAVPLLADASATVRSAHTQLARVDAIAADVQEVTANASALSSTVSSAFGGPLVKVAAFGYGVRRAIGKKGEPPPTRGAHRRPRPYPARRPPRRAPQPSLQGLITAMFRRAFWFTTGAAAGVWATNKVHRKLRKLQPDSLAAQAADKAVETGHRLRQFALDVRDRNGGP